MQPGSRWKRHQRRLPHKRLVLRCSWPSWDDGGAVMLCHLLIGLGQDSFRTGILDDTGLEVVRCEAPGNAAKIIVCMDVSSDPCFLLHVQKGLCIGITAVRQHGYKEIRRKTLTGVRIHDPGCLPAQSTCMFSPGLCSRCMVAFVLWT